MLKLSIRTYVPVVNKFVCFKSTNSSDLEALVKLDNEQKEKEKNNWWKNSNYYKNVENYYQFGPVVKAKWMKGSKNKGPEPQAYDKELFADEKRYYIEKDYEVNDKGSDIKEVFLKKVQNMPPQKIPQKTKEVTSKKSF